MPLLDTNSTMDESKHCIKNFTSKMRWKMRKIRARDFSRSKLKLNWNNRLQNLSQQPQSVCRVRENQALWKVLPLHLDPNFVKNVVHLDLQLPSFVLNVVTEEQNQKLQPAQTEVLWIFQRMFVLDVELLRLGLWFVQWTRFGIKTVLFVVNVANLFKALLLLEMMVDLFVPRVTLKVLFLSVSHVTSRLLIHI